MQIPITLEFNSVAPNATLKLSLSTPGASWSIGSTGRGSLGFSLNALALDAEATSCIRRIELWGGELIIAIDSRNQAKDFTLTTFLELPEDTWLIDGICVLSQGARVIARVGYARPVEWYDGKISAIITAMPLGIHLVTFVIAGAITNKSVKISLTGENLRNDYFWALAPNSAEGMALSFVPLQTGKTFISSLLVGATDIELTTAADGGTDPGVVEGVQLSVCVRRPVEPEATLDREFSRFFLSVDCDDNVSVTASVGHNRPRHLTSTFAPFFI